MFLIFLFYKDENQNASKLQVRIAYLSLYKNVVRILKEKKNVIRILLLGPCMKFLLSVENPIYLWSINSKWTSPILFDNFRSCLIPVPNWILFSSAISCSFKFISETWPRLEQTNNNYFDKNKQLLEKIMQKCEMQIKYLTESFPGEQFRYWRIIARE